MNHVLTLDELRLRVTSLSSELTLAKDTLSSRHIPERISELTTLTESPDLWNDHKKAEAMFTELKALKKQWEPLLSLSFEVSDLLTMMDGMSADDLSVAMAEYDRLLILWQNAERALYLGGKYDLSDAYISITAGAGGTDAQDWAGMLARMYIRYAERKEWTVETIERTDGQEAGVKSVTLLIRGDTAYGHLKCERGTHRLVRLSPFNAKSLRQTSFALVEVLPDFRDHEEIIINPVDLEIDTYRSSGAGGQHVNKTDSAVRMTHKPTGIVVACQNERSQIQNRERALSLLTAKLLERKHAEEEAERHRLKGSVTSADFGSQIRSYVLHPYQMVKDVRTNIETSATEHVLDGDIDLFIDAELKRSAKEE